jgi:hypothetical protein
MTSVDCQEHVPSSKLGHPVIQLDELLNFIGYQKVCYELFGGSGICLKRSL